jgi:hypothetical protein
LREPDLLANYFSQRLNLGISNHRAEMIVLDANILIRAVWANASGIYWINTPNTSLE